MAILQNSATGERIILADRCLLGRSRSMDVTVQAADVSAQHAAIVWNGKTWSIRDLGSRNGTQVKGKAIEPGVSCTLTPGVTIRIGESHEFTFVTDAPPSPTAASGDQWVEGDGELLALPSADKPEVLIVFAEGGWVARRGDQTEPCPHGTTLQAGGQEWQISLPELLSPTTDRTSSQRDLQNARLEFGVSSDEEYVELTVQFSDGSRHPIKPRAHLYVLLTLARQRMGDDDVADAERGWIHTAQLASMLRATSNQLYVSLHRARKDLAALGVLDPSELLERRSTSRQIRIGVSDLSVQTL